MNHVSEISFKVSRPDGTYGLFKLSETVFKLGLGPCGRHVTKLSVSVDRDFLRVTQWSRAADDLDPPPCPPNEVYTKLARDECAMRNEPIIRLRLPPQVYYTGFLWWKKRHVVNEPAPLPEKPKGALDPEERERLSEIIRDYKRAFAEWESRVEIKEFIYKISDVHGRIVTTK
ncbi:hypothetical protein [Pseudomonas phage PlaquesPlease]|uniref:Uncharacterized protein n=1 Tax=Pseudomonas phage PlaquesPlease TaxID=2762289 RepID=A0A7G8LJS2_9CAUD|nr:hypothetical protein [Pseudomonas phage PlaquesPlease]